MWNKFKRYQGIFAVALGYLSGTFVVADKGDYSTLFWLSLVMMAFAGFIVPDGRQTAEHS
jgi:hypothetical protein